MAVLHVPDRQFHPSPREPKFDPLAVENTKLCLDMRHIYIRHPKLQVIGRFRDEVSDAARRFFKAHSFLDFPAPILTKAILYEPSSAVPVQLGLKGVRSGPVYLTQCVGHYLEAAAMSHERVYSMCPSFRNESRSDRHLLEYWHIKAELAVGDMETIIGLVELFIKDVAAAVSVSGADTCQVLGTEWTPQEFSTPFPRLAYVDAVAYLQENGNDVTFEEGIKPQHEALLTRAVGERPLWIVGNSCKKEPFPYKIDKDDSRLTRTADLIAPNGFGEICGVAEKIVNSKHLAERMAVSGHDTLPHMSFVRDVHDCGTVPHVAFGMGFERLVKWMLKLGHVRDCHPFPRVYGRDVSP
jgi:asparaginyl-tRNA synthetase